MRSKSKKLGSADVALEFRPAKKIHWWAIAIVMCLAPVGAIATNVELRKLVAEDQSARRAGADQADWAVIRAADRLRRAQVLTLLRTQSLQTAEDFESAALIFQHGENPEDYRLAHGLATMAVTMEPSRRFARWLQTATWDRLMRSLAQPQWYGTQFKTNSESGAREPLPTATAIPQQHIDEMSRAPVYSAEPPDK